jgi:hypothetical protein
MFNILLLVLFAVLQAGDVWTTAAALKRGAEEANLFPRSLIARFGFWPAILGVKAVAIVIALLVTMLVANAYWFTGPLDLAGVAVLAKNIRVLRSI